MSDGEIREDEVSSLSGAVEISHARRRNTSQDGRVVSSAILDTAMSNGTGLLQARIKEEVGVVVESDVLAFFNGGTFDNAKFNNGRRINRSSVAVRYEGVSTKKTFLQKTMMEKSEASSIHHIQDRTFHSRTTCTSSLWLLQNRQLVPKVAVLSGHTVNALDHVPLAC